jgi:hypothetical protein
VNARSNSGTTPLHDAVKFLSQEIVEFLLDHGADPTIKDNHGKSAKDLKPDLFAGKIESPAIVTVPDSEEVAPASEAADSVPEEATTAKEHPGEAADPEMEVDPPRDEPAADQPQEENISELPEGEVPACTEEPPASAEPAEQQPPPVHTSIQSSTADETPPKPTIKPPLPFSFSKLPRSSPALSKMSRGARFVEMSKAKSLSDVTPSANVVSPTVALMSPKPEAELRTEPREEDLMTTPTQVLFLRICSRSYDYYICNIFICVVAG